MVAASLRVDRTRSHGFYVAMAAIFVLIAFGGFIPTYWAKLVQGSFHANPIVHIHGALFFAWTLFFLFQTALVAGGRTPDHRSWGLAGISLGTAMAISIVLAAMNSMKTADAAGFAEQGRQFAIVPLAALPVFVAFFAAAIANVRRPEIHKRLMLLTMMPLMHAAIFRVYLVSTAPPGAVGPPPAAAAIPPGLITDLLIVAGMIHDWRVRRRPHPVYVVGGAIMVAEEVLSGLLGASPAWLAFAAWVESLAG
jgi:hypothetical protein